MEQPVFQGIILDFGGVFTKTWQRERLLRQCEKELALARGSLAHLLFAGEHWWSVSTGKISPEEYWAYVRHALGGRVPAALEPFQYNPFAYEELNRRMVSLVRRWHRHYKIGLLSNATPYLEVLLAEYSLNDLFDVVVNSSRVGLRKPDSRMYQLLLTRLELLPQQCIFVDDKERNTEVAQALGMTVIVFRSAASLERQLQALTTSFR